MNVVALLSWFDEDERFLDRAISTAAAAGVSALVALDGAYALFDESAATRSGARQVKTIRRACRAAGIDLVLEQPDERWPTEMAKRTRLFQLGETITEPDDWYLILDSDYEIETTRPLPDLLADVAEDVATVTLLTPPGPGGHAPFGPQPVMPGFRAIFRAIRGLHVGDNHYTYLTPDGRLLWGNETRQHQEPAHELGDVRIHHWSYHRSKIRVGRQFDYYRARDQAGVELGPCMLCGDSLYQVMVPANLRVDEDGSFTAGWVEVCRGCESDAIGQAMQEAEQLGIPVGLEGLPRVTLAVGEAA